MSAQPNSCFCQTIWKQYCFRLYQSWLSEHGQQFSNTNVIAYNTAAPVAFSTVPVNMHNI